VRVHAPHEFSETGSRSSLRRQPRVAALVLGVVFLGSGLARLATRPIL
jgi:hypothetical protein